LGEELAGLILTYSTGEFQGEKGKGNSKGKGEGYEKEKTYG